MSGKEKLKVSKLIFVAYLSTKLHQALYYIYTVGKKEIQAHKLNERNVKNFLRYEINTNFQRNKYNSAL